MIQDTNVGHATCICIRGLQNPKCIHAENVLVKKKFGEPNLKCIHVHAENVLKKLFNMYIRKKSLFSNIC